MRPTPLVSVIIPTFNSSLHLRRCFDSVLNQSIKELEILVVDDLSTDGTLKILRSYEEKYPQIKVIALNKKGFAGGARNAGMHEARGKYFSFVDSDDWIDTNFYYHLVNSLEKTSADIALCGVIREYENAKNSTVRYKYDQANLISGRFALSLLSRVIDQDIAISSIVCNKLFKSNFIRENKIIFYDNCINEDDIFTFHSFLEAETIAISNMTNYHLYQRKNSISRSFSKRNIDDLFFSFGVIKSMLFHRGLFNEMKFVFYAFFEKCFSFVIESMMSSVQDDEILNAYLKHAYHKAKETLSFEDFIDYCGHRRLIDFFKVI